MGPGARQVSIASAGAVVLLEGISLKSNYRVRVRVRRREAKTIVPGAPRGGKG
jgi:hypothetical protein